MENKKIVLHIITSLGDGGAEGVLFRLCTTDKKNENVVISLMEPTKYSQLLLSNGITVKHLNFHRGSVSFKGLYRLYKEIKLSKAEIVQTWMYHSDLFGGLLARLSGVNKVFWNIRHSNLDIKKTKKSTIYIAKLCALLSRIIPTKIICCAEQARQSHIDIGYIDRKMVVIENGYDLSRFHRIQAAPLPILNQALNAKTKPLIGMVGRYTPEKDHNNLFQALSLLNSKGKDFSLVLAGTGMDTENKNVLDLIERHKLNDKVLLLGAVSNVPLLMNYLDIHVLSSSSEGFPNVLAEAMACGTPCISTKAGAAERILGSTGWLVPTSNPEKLADAIQESIFEFEQHKVKWNERRIAAEQRIKNNFSIEVMVDKYNEVWSS